MIGLLASLALAGPTLPTRSLTTLSGEAVTWPDTASVVLVSFARSHNDDAVAWQAALGDHPWRQWAVVGELGKTTRWIVTTAMRGSYDDSQEARTALVLEAPDGLVASLELSDADTLAVVVVDDAGQVRWSHRGPPTDEAVTAATAALEAL